MRNHKIGVVYYLFCLFVCLLTVLKSWIDGLMLIRILAVQYCTYVVLYWSRVCLSVCPSS